MKELIYRFLTWLKVIPDMDRESEMLRIRGEVMPIMTDRDGSVAELGYSQMNSSAKVALVALHLRRMYPKRISDQNIAKHAAMFWWDLDPSEVDPLWLEKPL